MNKEVWKPILGYEDLYAVSNRGNVKRVERTHVWYTKKSPGPKHMHFREMKLTPYFAHPNYKYPSVLLRKNSKNAVKRIHRLVAEAFVPNPNNYRWIQHVDGNNFNNQAENLIWVKSLH